jgi:hypothetical protein
MNDTHELSRTVVNQGMCRIALAVAIQVMMIGLSAGAASAAPAPKALSASPHLAALTSLKSPVCELLKHWASKSGSTSQAIAR